MDFEKITLSLLLSVKMSMSDCPIEFGGAPYIHSDHIRGPLRLTGAAHRMKVAARGAVNQAIRRYPVVGVGSTDLQFEADVEEAMDAHDNYTHKVWKCSHTGILHGEPTNTVKELERDFRMLARGKYTSIK